MGARKSVLFYGELFANALGKEGCRKCLMQVPWWEPLRMVCDQRIASELVVMAIIGVIRIALLSKEQKNIYKCPKKMQLLNQGKRLQQTLSEAVGLYGSSATQARGCTESMLRFIISLPRFQADMEVLVLPTQNQ